MLIAITLLVPALQSARVFRTQPRWLARTSEATRCQSKGSRAFSRLLADKRLNSAHCRARIPEQPPPCVPLASLGFLAPARPEGGTRRGPAARSAPKPSRMAEPKGRALPSRGPRILPDRTRRGSPSPAEAAPDPPRRRLRSRPRPRCAAPRAAGGQQGWGGAAGFWGV